MRSDLCVAFIAQVLQGSTRRHSRLPMGPHGNLAYRFHRGPYLRLFELFFSQATDRCGRRYTDNYNIKWGLVAKATDRYGKKSSDGAEAETYGGSAGIPGLWTQVLVWVGSAGGAHRCLSKSTWEKMASQKGPTQILVSAMGQIRFPRNSFRTFFSKTTVIPVLIGHWHI